MKRGKSLPVKGSEKVAVRTQSPSSHQLRRNERTSVAGATLIVMALIGLSRLTGIIRDIGRTTLFGRDWHTDAYVSAFSIPDLIYFLASGGALSAGFIPVFTGYLTKGEDEKAIKTFRVLMTYLGIPSSPSSSSLSGLPLNSLPCFSLAWSATNANSPSPSASSAFCCHRNSFSSWAACSRAL